jgi:hypothetical protein
MNDFVLGFELFYKCIQRLCDNFFKGLAGNLLTLLFPYFP